MKNLIAAGALMSALMGSAACAEPAPSAQTTPAAATAPKPDGRTRAEFLAQAAKRFDAMDSNKDGVLSIDERRAAHALRHAGEHHAPGAERLGPGGPRGFAPPQAGGDQGRGPQGAGGRGAMLGLLDTNGDGKLTAAEFSAPFDRLDVNKDGFVDQTERNAIPSGGAGGSGAGPAGGARMARLDRDGDGKISRAEFDMPFGRLDANQDGVIDQAELARLRALGGRFGGGRFGGNRLNPAEAQNEPQ